MTEKQIYDKRVEALATLFEQMGQMKFKNRTEYFEHLKTLDKETLACIAYVASLMEFDEFLTQFGAKNVPIN